MEAKGSLTVRAPSKPPSVTSSENMTSPLVADSVKKTVTITNRSRALTGKTGLRLLREIPFDLVLSILVWYYVGVGGICTTKVLLSTYSVPPLVLTFQQLVIGSSLLRLHLWATGTLQSLRKQEGQLRNRRQLLSVYHNLFFAGLYNALDFAGTNTSFSLSSASFVETIKASEPITTTAIALFYGIEVLNLPEALSMLLLVTGVFVSTWGNTKEADDGSSFDSAEAAALRWRRSIKTCLIVFAANICFAFRTKAQKALRAQKEWKKVSDANLLMRMQQAGALSLLVPVALLESNGIMQRTRESTWQDQMLCCALSLLNASAFAVCMVCQFQVLSRLSVAQFMGLGCLRRMNAIVCTAVAFGVAISPLSAVGTCLSICGFSSFSCCRHSNPPGSDGRPSPATSLSPNLASKMVGMVFLSPIFVLTLIQASCFAKTCRA